MNYIDHVDFRVLNTDVLEEMVKKLGYNDGLFFSIHYKEPYCSLDFGLRTLKCDVDLEPIFDHVRQGVHMIDMYVEHRRSTILIESSEGPVGPCKAIVPATFLINNQNHSLNEDEEEIEDHNEESEEGMQKFRANVEFTREELDGSNDGDHDDETSEEGHLPVDLEDFESGSDDNSSLRDKVARKKRRRNKGGLKGPNDLPFFVGQLIDDKNKMNQMVKDYALKGLIPAMLAVFPNGEHRFCLRHIHENMKSKWHGYLYKNLLGSAGRKTSIPYFNKAMEEIKTTERAMYDWLNEIPYTAWSSAYFSGRAKCDMLLNNICEVFNRQIIGARDKPIITCLEFIREYMTKRIVNVKKLQAKCMGPLTPHATEVYDEIKKQAAEMSVLMVDSDKKWDLTGMPCKHAVAAIWDMSRNSIDAGIPEEWVSDVYWLSTWKKVYENVIEPINGLNMWTPSQCPTTLIPPKHHTRVGRPKKKRKEAFGEKELEQEFDKGGKMTRKGSTIKCGKCGNMGHNVRSCKGQGGEQATASQELHTATQGALVDNLYE
ncbi:uncharacterized protein LOC110943349 [Helianthus annuus]|uniref:uncharacterized protein LOC110943349 n=1 Tax=Helianthus annuus TaxID=4232 RepID=UPI000B900FD9|nr:uncharacterized protein LOC110943349 [Helianthus annuus]